MLGKNDSLGNCVTNESVSATLYFVMAMISTITTLKWLTTKNLHRRPGFMGKVRTCA